MGQLALERPLLEQFTKLIDQVSDDGVADFAVLQTQPFIRFWPNLVIYRHEPDARDFRILLFGTKVATNYEKDWSGLLVKDSGFGKGYETIYNVNMGLISGGNQRLADSGTFNFQNRDHVNWYEIKMPLRRNGEINEVLVIMDFN